MSAASVVTRLVGLWILAGATLKLLYGTPVDLPEVIQELPLGLGLTFKLAIGVEFVVGLLALLRPSVGWLPALLLSALFLGVLATQVAAGDESCGCFGTAVTISPVVMLAIDAACFVLLLVTRPWRRRPAGPELAWLPLVVLLLACASLPWFLDREGTADGNGAVVGRPWVDLDVPGWKDKPLAETRIHPLLGEDLQLENGVFIIWRATCPVCAELLEIFATTDDGSRDVVLIELSDPHADESDEHGEGAKVHVLPEGSHVKRIRLPDDTDWLVTPPAWIEVEDGVVTRVVEGDNPLR